MRCLRGQARLLPRLVGGMQCEQAMAVVQVALRRRQVARAAPSTRVVTSQLTSWVPDGSSRDVGVLDNVPRNKTMFIGFLPEEAATRSWDAWTANRRATPGA